MRMNHMGDGYYTSRAAHEAPVGWPVVRQDQTRRQQEESSGSREEQRSKPESSVSCVVWKAKPESLWPPVV
jgi:hypothetical protein